MVNGADCRLAGTWLLPTGQSCWVWQQADGQPVNTTRTFRTTFDLTGYDAGSAFIGDGFSINATSWPASIRWTSSCRILVA